MKTSLTKSIPFFRNYHPSRVLRGLFSFDWGSSIRKLLSFRWVYLEWIVIILVAYSYGADTLLNFDSNMLQTTGEHNESATRPLLAEYGLIKNLEIPLWNHFMQTGFPQAGDLLSHFWSPIATIPVLLFGGIDGMKVSVFLAFLLAGFGQWYLGNICGLKGMFRVWAALIFMLSGGLALFWRVGWYELLLGASCFPWAIGSFWQALNKKDKISLVWAAFWIANILLTGGGYYPFYFGGIALIMIMVGLFFSKGNLKQVFLRSLYAFLLTVGLVAVMLIPMIDGFRLINREGGLDVDQKGSQPVSYALLNYVISTPEWFNTSILGTTGGWNWFYIGSLSLAGWIFLPMAVKNRRSKNTTITLIAITLFLLLWVANKFTFFNQLYEFIPILKSLRFPNRLLVIAVIPILIISGLSWQSTFVKLKRATRKMSMGLHSSSPKLIVYVRFATVVSILYFLFTWISVQDVYQINKGFSFAPRPLDQNASETLIWLKNYDDSIYYTWIGEFGPYWNWLPAAYQNELPVINFVYSQKLSNRIRQYDASSPFNAQPKYQVVSMAVPAPEGSVLVHANSGAGIYLYPDSLPFSFSTLTQNIESLTPLTTKNVSGAPAKFDGPNRILLQVASSQEKETLVILVSDYPGWRVLVDGKEGQYRPVNGYLSTPLQLGNHSYMFVFDPISHKIGLTITLISIFFSIALILSDITKKLIEKSAPVVEQIAE